MKIPNYLHTSTRSLFSSAPSPIQSIIKHHDSAQNFLDVTWNQKKSTIFTTTNLDNIFCNAWVHSPTSFSSCTSFNISHRSLPIAHSKFNSLVYTRRSKQDFHLTTFSTYTKTSDVFISFSVFSVWPSIPIFRLILLFSSLPEHKITTRF